jgi:L-asparaginase II
VPDRTHPVVLAEVVRSGFVEGVHRGSLVVLDPDGSVALARGDVDVPVFPRSSNKLMQAVGMVELGYAGQGDLLALAAASHSGEPHHVDGVRRILASCGLDVGALRTPAEWPLGEQAFLDVVRAGGEPSPVLMNCSGKHAAMIATCVAQGWSLDDYRALDHPLQQHLVGTIERMSGERVAATGVDGCGAPVAAISLTALARAFAAAVQAEPARSGGTPARPGDVPARSGGTSGAPERAVADAMRAHPEFVGGTGHDVTRLMAGVPGLLVKDGAEGVYAAALADGRAFALKVDDGAARPRPLVAAAVLRHLGVEADVLADFEVRELLGGGRRVGEIRVPPHLLP